MLLFFKLNLKSLEQKQTSTALETRSDLSHAGYVDQRKVCIMNIRILILALTLTACSSHPVLPQKTDIKITREEPSKDCENLGAIVGRSHSIHATPEEALEDLKVEAIQKGANVVKVETMGAQSAAIKGTAYYCK